MTKRKKSRRKFLKQSGIVAAGFTIVPRYVLGGKGYTAPSDKLNIAAIGAGGKGHSSLRALKSENIVALADVDWNRAKQAFEDFPLAKKYKDYRVMLDKHPEIDAVVISTPDHTHAITGLACMDLDKHVYIEKPLAHTIEEVRALTEMASRKPHLITQMGNQGASGEGIRRSQELYESGLIGEVTKVVAWTNRPVWPQGGPVPTEAHPVPEHLDWNLWLGPAEWRDFNEAYLPFSWRGYWDFGTGALGDMGCHILDTPFYMLELGYPIAAEASVGQVYSQPWNADYHPGSCPPSSKIHIKFPARGEKPPVELVWMDGGILPKRPDELSPEDSMGAGGGGFILEGTKGKLLADVYGRNPRLLPLSKMEDVNVPLTIPRIEHSHNMDWVLGIKENYQPSSHFGKAGPLTETVLMGNLAIRSYNYRAPGSEGNYTLPGRTTLLWDGPNMNVTNLEFANQFVRKQNPRNF